VNVIFLSPHFPPPFFHFCQALRKEGVNVLGLGDAPHDQLSAELREVLTGYYHVADMSRYDEVARAVGFLIYRHGRIDRIDSLNEHWLELEARLREDFNIPGQRPADTARNRSKTSMREILRAAGVPSTEGERLTSNEHAWALAARFGYPLVIKPDIGVGAARTFKINNELELRAALEQPLEGFIVEKFVAGSLTSFDGIAGRDGSIVFCTSHVYSSGIMDIVNHQLPMHYYSRRAIPPQLEEIGRKVVKAFNVRERFFHIELFDTAEGYRALEINVRPPGGFTTDMMDFACDIDVYGVWAKVLTGKSLDGWQYERRYFCAHASRRGHLAYRFSHQEILRQLGGQVMLHRGMPPILAGAMGDYFYLIRDANESALKQSIGLIEALA
jgi:hypothetical protein